MTVQEGVGLYIADFGALMENSKTSPLSPPTWNLNCMLYPIELQLIHAHGKLRHSIFPCASLTWGPHGTSLLLHLLPGAVFSDSRSPECLETPMSAPKSLPTHLQEWVLGESILAVWCKPVMLGMHNSGCAHCVCYCNMYK